MNRHGTCWFRRLPYRLTAEQRSCSGEKSKSWSERNKRLAMILFSGGRPLFSCGRGTVVWAYGKSYTHTIALKPSNAHSIYKRFQPTKSRPYVYGHVRAGYFVHRKRCVTSIINDAETEMYIHMGFSQKSHNPNFVSKLGL